MEIHGQPANRFKEEISRYAFFFDPKKGEHRMAWGLMGGAVDPRASH